MAVHLHEPRHYPGACLREAGDRRRHCWCHTMSALSGVLSWCQSCRWAGLRIQGPEAGGGEKVISARCALWTRRFYPPIPPVCSFPDDEKQQQQHILPRHHHHTQSGGGGRIHPLTTHRQPTNSSHPSSVHTCIVAHRLYPPRHHSHGAYTPRRHPFQSSTHSVAPLPSFRKGLPLGESTTPPVGTRLRIWAEEIEGCMGTQTRKPMLTLCFVPPAHLVLDLFTH